MMLKGQRGGLWLDLKKKPAADRPVEELKAPAKLYLPLRQCKGVLPDLIAREGEHVLMGQTLAVAGEGLSCALHSPVSGTVTEIGEYDHPLGGKSAMITIENDWRDLPFKKSSNADFKSLTGADIIALVKNAAVAESSGYELPFWCRLSVMAEKKVSTIVINAVETEPFICTSQKLLDESPDRVADGLSAILKCTGAKKVMLAISDDIPEPVVEGAAESARLIGIELKLEHLPQKYPLGNERYLMKTIFNKDTHGAPPEDFGVGFVYAENCAAVHAAVTEVRPQLTRIITVAGDAVENPQNLEVRIGTTVRDVLDHCGLDFDPDRVVLGSAMRGAAITSLDTPITKSVTAVLAIKAARGGLGRSICINCGKCARVCPQGLLPNYIAMRAVKADFSGLNELNINDCIECGSCAYICPGRMPITELIKNIKRAAL